MVGRFTVLCCGLLLVGCDLNPRGELPGADNGGPPMVGETTVPPLPEGPPRPPIDPLPDGWPEFPSPDPNDDETSGDDAPINETDDLPLPPDGPLADDDTIGEGPIFTDAGAAAPALDAGAPWPPYSPDGGASAALDAGVSDPDDSTETDEPTDAPSGSDASVAYDASIPGFDPSDAGDAGDAAVDDGGASSGDAGAPDAAVDAGSSDAATSDDDAGP